MKLKDIPIEKQESFGVTAGKWWQAGNVGAFGYGIYKFATDAIAKNDFDLTAFQDGPTAAAAGLIFLRSAYLQSHAKENKNNVLYGQLLGTVGYSFLTAYNLQADLLLATTASIIGIGVCAYNTYVTYQETIKQKAMAIENSTIDILTTFKENAQTIAKKFIYLKSSALVFATSLTMAANSAANGHFEMAAAELCWGIGDIYFGLSAPPKAAHSTP